MPICCGKGYIEFLHQGLTHPPILKVFIFDSLFWVSFDMPFRRHIIICHFNDATLSAFPVPCNMRPSDSNECWPIYAMNVLVKKITRFLPMIYFRRVIVLYQSLNRCPLDRFTKKLFWNFKECRLVSVEACLAEQMSEGNFSQMSLLPLVLASFFLVGYVVVVKKSGLSR